MARFCRLIMHFMDVPRAFKMITIVLTMLVLYRLLHYIQVRNIASDAEPSKPLIILVWHWPFGSSFKLSGDVCFDLYGIRDCLLTEDRAMYTEADVVVFHHRELQNKRSSLPEEERPSNQKWVWVSLESPSATSDVKKFNGIFNWTMTYRQDSDIFMPYGELCESQIVEFSIPNKTSVASWVVSNYNTKQQRVQFYMELVKFLPVRVFGKMNNNPLCTECLLPTISKDKFYLAFENSVHKDYITEKIWRNSFMAGTVPVVLGPSRKNYENFIPTDSFIHVEDFSSPKGLADFLLALSANETQYQQYFQWRKRYSVKLYTDWKERFCTICNRFSTLPQRKVYHDLNSWFNE
ncbi:alpha-(1,3)-fucosyltransferase 7 [Protopterus annectens]|uniref:alpha-(1,3)-fucosyltransferase 7 n=1 Tax=Protopterus annectens TaxID=7888 RepID=UPI001CF9BB47|nr:alpha-(1,3)-fucosyltransferase 7 [Protopterus annectens]XP_043914570.1 alpha-(1,3)-fucosyltransferase 7 [Protopterus annectens]XP_043914571.1 alpha-(1,3)-fucosyltransferase 7 [Protopterus annectens]XP_043914572.1 alpha-(1,3)-fucosyltransferase 7 [Protopterus annectens]